MEFSLFDEAARDHDADRAEHRAALVRTAVASDLMPFLAGAVSDRDYANRKALAEEGIHRIAHRCEASAGEVADTADRLYASLRSQASLRFVAQAIPCSNCNHTSVDHTEGLRCQCGCANFAAGSSATATRRTEARRVTAEGDDGPFS